MVDVVHELDRLIDMFEGHDGLLTTRGIMIAARDEILVLRNQAAEAQYYEQLVEAYEQRLREVDQKT